MRLFRWKLLLAILILVSLAGRLYVIAHTDGMWWDEAVYLGLGRALFENRYTLEPGIALESFRPPATAVLVSTFHSSAQAARSLVAALSALSVLAVYCLGKELFGRKEGLAAAAFTGTSYLFVFFSSKVMSEPLFIMLFSVSAIFFARWHKSGRLKELFLCGAVAGGAFMTRYLAYALVLAYIIYLLSPLLKKRLPEPRPLAALLSGFLVSLVPWFWIGQHYYGSPVGSFVTNFNIWTFSFAQTFLEGLWMLGSSLNYVWAFLLIGLYALYRNRRKRSGPAWVLVLVLAISVVFFLGSSHKEPRYLLSFFPAYAVLAGAGAERLLYKGGAWKAGAVITIAALSVTTMSMGLQDAWGDRHSASGLYQAALELQSLTYPGEPILTQSYPYVYLVGRGAVTYCGNCLDNEGWEECQAQIIARTWSPSAIRPLMEKHNITYILSYRFELMNPARTVAYLDREFEKVESWGQWGEPEAVVIYRANVTAQSSPGAPSV